MQCGIEFDALKWHIWYDNHLSSWFAVLTIISCFAHIVNLACKAVLTAITNIDYAHDDDANFVLQPGQPINFMAACRCDPIATARSIVWLIHGSSIRWQIFSEILESLHDVDNLQLLRDVITHWSSTLLMIERILYLCPAINGFLSSRDFPEFYKYQLSNAEWTTLSDFKNILAVPHAFQQILSCEKTPCISDTIPAFEAMQFTWEELQKEMPYAADIIAKGLEKLAEYRGRVNDVPIYSLAICMLFSSF
ncbi:ribonuclease H-like domain-containing protein [Armillaria mellea]|nr:ribonuclease H-like domain-containing protein [Armillaria mellea]KAK0184216.1 ribonuclease H-like domain-containing protein [Armillaria mellea]